MSHTSLETQDHDAVSAQHRGILSDEQWRLAGHELQLSCREIEITQRFFDDHTEQAIAKDLSISSHTVHTHVERLYRKLHVNSRVGVVLHILQLFVHD